MKRVRFAADANGDGNSNLPMAETVAFNDDDERIQDDEQEHRSRQEQQQQQQQLQNRVNYTVHDNKQYYELCSMIIVVYMHVKQGLPVSSLFLPRENTNPDYDF